MQEKRKVFNIGKKKQLFIDKRLVDSCKNVSFVANSPQRSGEVLLEPSPREAENGLNFGLFSSVLREGDRIRLWYFAQPDGDVSGRRLCYAESKDGLNFTRPEIHVGKAGIDGIPNAVIKDPVQGGCVWVDPNAPPERRYRTQAKWGPPEKFEGKGSSLHFYSSPDGISWEETHYLHIGDCDTQTVVFWDESYGRYAMYTRKWERFTNRQLSFRKVRRLDSSDLKNWENETIVWEADKLDLFRGNSSAGTPSVDFYGACVFKYPEADNLYIALLQAFWHWFDRPDDEKWGYNPDPENLSGRILRFGPATIDVRLGYSRDGIRFERPEDRRAFMGNAPDGSFDSRFVWVLPRPVVTDKEIWFYYTGSNRDHDGFLDYTASRMLSGIGRASLRIDGFVSAEADREGGFIITPPVLFNGEGLNLNLDAPAGGSVKVEILDEGQKPVPGYAKSDAVPVCGNSVSREVRWNGSGLYKLKGRTVRFKFYLKDAKLFSFKAA